MSSSYIHKKIIGLVIFVAFLFGLSGVAHALTLTPIRLEIAGDPGQVLDEQMTLINEGTTPQTFYSSYANFEAQGETGTPTFVTPTDDLGTWIEAPSSATLSPRESKTVPIKITIPKNAEPGGHFAAIFWGTTPSATTPGSVAIGAKTGMLVLLRVNGDVAEKGGIIQFGLESGKTFYTALPVSFFYRFQNNGGDRIEPTGNLLFKDILGITEAKISGNPVEGNVLPGSIRRIEMTWQGKGGPNPPTDRGNFFTQAHYEWNNFALGRYKAKLALNYGTQNEVATAAVVFWVFPWQLLLVLIVLFLFIFFVIRALIRSYNRWVIKKAGEMIRREQEQQKKEIDSGLPSN